jgi:hypothetical protein
MSEPTEEEKKIIEKEQKRLKEEAEKDKLKEEEEYKKLTDIERKKYFKGTIVVIVIYAVFILAMCVAGIASPMMRELLFVYGFPFTTTFISGVILVIIILLAQIFTYKPAAMPEKYAGDNLSCPDYWILKKTPQAVLQTITDKKVRQLSKYYCSNPNDTSETSVPSSGTANEQIKLNEVSTLYTSTSISTDYHMKCNRLYPDYMASIDKKNFPLDPTKMRCKYVERCTDDSVPVSWTNVCSK